MKRTILAVGLVLALAGYAMAGANPGTGIKGTSHDLSSTSGVGAQWGAGTLADPTLDRICIYCHAPHHTASTTDIANLGLTAYATYYPLWNHGLTQVTNYTLYSSGSVTPNLINEQNNAASTIGQPGSVSRLCLSCHDGSVAISTYGNFDGGVSPSHNTGNVMASGRILIGGGGNLANHHPIGFDYNAVAAVDDEINNADTPIGGPNPYGITINDLLWNGMMECSSCHDVHNTKAQGVKFTWVQDTNSALCFTCHNK